MLFVFQTVSKAESWNFIYRDSININSRKCELLKNNEVAIAAEVSSNQYEILIENEEGWNPLFSDKYWSENSKFMFFSSPDLLYHNGDLFITSGGPDLFKYSNNELKRYYVDDKYNNEDHQFNFIREFFKIFLLEGKIYVLAYAMNVNSYEDGTPRKLIIDSTFTELFLLENEKLTLIEKFNFRLKDLSIDNDGIFWFNTTKKLYRYDGNISEIDILSKVNLDIGPLLLNACEDNYIYILRGPNFHSDIERPFFIRYNKITEKAEKFFINENPKRPYHFNKIESINDRVYIGSVNGLFYFENDTVKYFDIIKPFLDKIPEFLHNPPNIYDWDWDVRNFYIMTNVGLIYSTDFFSSVEANSSVEKINVYPNVLRSTDRAVTLECDKIRSIQNIKLFDLSGATAADISGFPPLLSGKTEINLPVLSSGCYYLVIRCKEGDYIAPVIIKN